MCPLKAEQYARNRAEVSKRFSTLFRQCGIRLHRAAGAAGRAGVEAGFHSLRFSFVSICRRADTPLAVVERLVGHSNAAMTRHYTDVGDDATAKAISSLPSLPGWKDADGADAAKPPEPAGKVSSMGDDDLARLAAVVAAEMARRGRQ